MIQSTHLVLVAVGKLKALHVEMQTTSQAFRQKRTEAVKRNCMSGPVLIFSLSVAQKPKSSLGRLTVEV
jgi:transposase